MREVLGAGRGVQAGVINFETPAIAAGGRREGDEEKRGRGGAMRRATEATGHMTKSAYDCASMLSRKALSFGLL